MPHASVRLVGSLLLLLPAFIACSGGEVPADGGSSSTAGHTAEGGGGQSANGGNPVEGGGGNGGTAAVGGQGGDGGQGGGTTDEWPACDAQPTGSTETTIEDIWADEPGAPTFMWLPNVYVTAVSRGGCSAGVACQLFVQQDESYGSLAEATHKSLRIAVSTEAASHFTGVSVGDVVSLAAFALRDTLDGHNELMFLVTPTLRGCILPFDSASPSPVVATLDDLDVAAYEEDIGPVLVQLDTVSGKPALPDETFGLWDTGSIQGGDITTVTSLSPFFLPNATFNGLVQDQITDFDRVVGVFGLFVPDADPLIKYEEIYVRTDADYPLAN